MEGVFQVILIYLTASCIMEICLSSSDGLQPRFIAPDGSCECGRKNLQIDPRIVGGIKTGVNEYPWIVHLYFKVNKTKGHCGGSIINDRFILTAAHCVDGMKQRNVSIYIGDHKSNTESETDVQIQYPQAIFIHENFKWSPLTNDVALIKTAYKIRFNNIVSPICLPKPGEDFSGEFATAVGWGRTAKSALYSSRVLRKVEVKVLSDRDCKAESNNGVRYFPEVLCATGNRKGICNGDSGGPLAVQNKLGRYEQIGVVSFTHECSELGFPDGYARVTNYLDWIGKHVNYCSKGKVVYRT